MSFCDDCAKVKHQSKEIANLKELVRNLTKQRDTYQDMVYLYEQTYGRMKA